MIGKCDFALIFKNKKWWLKRINKYNGLPKIECTKKKLSTIVVIDHLKKRHKIFVFSIFLIRIQKNKQYIPHFSFT